MSTVNVLGMDYGASNGRGIVGSFDGEKLNINEVHRFPNKSVQIGAGTYWDILNLYNELKTCISESRSKHICISSIGIDTWGLDFAILDSKGNLLGNPHTYRDTRTKNILEKFVKGNSRYEMFLRTGYVPLGIETFFQLLSMKEFEPDILEIADKLLFIPNLLNYFLTGESTCENTIASISVMLDIFEKAWIGDLLKSYDLPDILPKLIRQGEMVGRTRGLLKDEIGINSVPVVSIAHHDTASAIAAVPAADKEEIIYISCGTWSVVGTKTARPLIDEDVFKNGFVNELGYNDEIMFVKNLTGLWILQECEREWAGEGYVINYEHMQHAAEKSDFESFIDTNDPVFAEPGNMQKKISDYCIRTSQAVPVNKEEYYSCVVLGLAMAYKEAIDQIIKLTGKRYKRIHIIGGGSRNKYLCRMTSVLTGMEVAAGPYEATVIGNILAQLIYLKEIKDLDEGVQIIEKSFECSILT